MRESCLVYCYSGIQSLFEVVLLYTFFTCRVKCVKDVTVYESYRDKLNGTQGSNDRPSSDKGPLKALKNGL